MAEVPHSAENGLRPDVTPDAVVALRLAADAMPISRPGQQWSGAADWLRRRADAFEVAIRDLTEPCEHDTLGCGWREPHEAHVKTGDGRPCCGWPPRCRDTQPLPLHRTEAGYPNCSTCDGGGCPDCTDPA